MTRSYFSSKDEASRAVHPITSDLWEEITGEHLSPATICQLIEGSFPAPDAIQSRYSLADKNLNVGSPSSQIVSMAKDKQRSRILQQKLEGCTAEEQTTIFNGLFSAFDEIIFDTSASFVLQKLCETTTEAQQQLILNYFLLSPYMYVEQQASCRVMQRFIECTKTENVEKLYFSLKDRLLPLCMSQNGNHIIQRFVDRLPDQVPDIVNIIQPKVISLAVDGCGCRVVQKLFDSYDIELLLPLVSMIFTSAIELAKNQYGNYIIQNIFTSQKKEHINYLLKCFSGHFYDFSIHKFASNVIEKCIRATNSKQREAIFEEIIGPPSNIKYERIRLLAADQFGNYVIQRIIEYGNSDQQNAVFTCVHTYYEELVPNSYSKHVIAKLRHLGYQFNHQ